jgi:hypothetical protein
VREYPHGLAVAMVNKHAQIDHFWRTDMFTGRGDNMLTIYEMYVHVAKKLIYTLLGLNHIYCSGYSTFKWLDRTIAQMEIVPANLGPRLKSVFRSERRVAEAELSSLVEEVYSLVEQHMPEVDVERLRRIFRYRRQPWDEPPPGLL